MKNRRLVFDESKPYKLIDDEIANQARLEAIDRSRKITLEIIQRVSSIIEEVLVKRANDELKLVNLQLKVDAKKAFYKYAMKKVFDSDVSVKEKEIDEAVEKFHQEKAQLKDYYISQLQPQLEQNLNLSPKEIHEALSTLLTSEISKALLQYSQAEAKKKLETNLAKKEKKFSRLSIQMDLDKQLKRKDTQWLMDYITKPRLTIIEEFNQRWAVEEKDTVNPIQNYFRMLISNFLTKLLDTFKNLNKVLKQSNMKTRDLAFLQQNINMQEYSVYFLGQSTLRFMFLYAIKELGNLNLDTMMYQSLIVGQNLSLATSKLENEHIQIIKKVREHFWYSSIINPTRFLDIFISDLEDLKTKLANDSIEIDEIKKNYFERAVGCQMQCPCCARLCDVEHFRHVAIPIGNPGNQHKCRLGHQIRGMNGYKINITNEASTKICSEINNLDLIGHNEKAITWKDFKEIHNTWDFDTREISKKELIELRGKFRHVWKEIGPELCQRNSEILQTPIIFVEYNKPVVQDIHYIFIIDGSSSMKKNDGWKHMMEGLTTFFTEMSEAKSESTVSIIVFSNIIKATLINQPFTPQLVSQIQFPGGGTDFSEAFHKAKTLLKMFKEKHRFRIIFMSDGEDDVFSLRTIKSLKKRYGKDIDMFWAIGYALVQDNSLQAMSNIMKGTYLKTLTGLQLQAQLSEISVSQCLT